MAREKYWAVCERRPTHGGDDANMRDDARVLYICRLFLPASKFIIEIILEK